MMTDIPVKVVCPQCVACPDIQIDVNRFEYGGDGKTFFQNQFFCKNYNRCCMMNNYLTKNLIEKEANKKQELLRGV